MRTNAKYLAKQLVLAALVLVPLAGRAANADVAVKISTFNDAVLNGSRPDPHPGAISPTQTKRQVITLTNNGPSTALGVEIAEPTIATQFKQKPTVPPVNGVNPPFKGAYGISNVTGCVLKSFTCTGVYGETGSTETSQKCTKAGEPAIDPNDARSWPCKIASISDVPGTTASPKNVAKVNLDITWPGPIDDPETDNREDIPAACPTAETLAPTAVTVTTTGSTDTDTGNNTASGGGLPTVDPTDPTNSTTPPTASAVAFLTLKMAADRETADPGQQFNVFGEVKNLGPCVSEDVWVIDWDGVSDIRRTWVEGSTTGCQDAATNPTDTNVQVDWADTNGDGCELGDIAVGQTKQFGANYLAGSMQNDEMHRATTINAQAYSGLWPYYFQHPSNGALTLDPDETDNGKAVNVTSKQDASSCATGGMSGALGLLLAALPLIRRRRR